MTPILPPTGPASGAAGWSPRPELVAELDLVDHHCHALVGHDLDRDAFELLLGESEDPAPPGCSTFDTSLGLAVRTWCAPVLDLPAGVGATTYLARRAELGSVEVNRRLLAGGARHLLVDTGYRSDELVPLDTMAAWIGGSGGGASISEIARLETLAEGVAAQLTGRGAGAAGYADALAAAMADHAGAVGWKSVAAYRGGLDLDWRRPDPAEVRTAAAEWLSAGPRRGPGGETWRLEHPVLVRHGVWCAVDTGRPVQFHTGFGDTDARLIQSNPAHLWDLIAATADAGTPLMLLHCWPYHREAGHLASVWPHVYLDVGEAIPHVGGRAAAVLAEALELAPWHKVLYASDAFGLAEIYHLGARLHRDALARVLVPLDAAGYDTAELTRLAALVAAGNARRVYGLPDPAAA